MNRDAGIAMILAIFMVLILSVLGSSLMFVSQTETFSSLNYRLTSQARYGAESGVHKATNYLLYGGYAAPGDGADPVSNYVLTVSPVTYGGDPVVLSSDPDVDPNYPVEATQTAFANATEGTMNVDDGSVTFSSPQGSRSSIRPVAGSTYQSASDDSAARPKRNRPRFTPRAGNIRPSRDTRNRLVATKSESKTPALPWRFTVAPLR